MSRQDYSHAARKRTPGHRRDRSHRIGDWPGEPLAERLERCRRFLQFHGAITEHESREVARRLGGIRGGVMRQRMSGKARKEPTT